jgi:hypothetical protein
MNRESGRLKVIFLSWFSGGAFRRGIVRTRKISLTHHIGGYCNYFYEIHSNVT